MIPNGTSYSNFPAFGINGTKTPPGGSTESAKYALGMVPADTFPAEWANYFFYGATAGITRLNQDTGSIKKEINNVLNNFNITPDASVESQLMTALTMLKKEAALAAHPVGSLYWTSKNENPATTFGGGTWTQIKDKFVLAAGDSYTNAATGGNATVTLTMNNLPSHTHSFTPAGTVSAHTHSFTPAGTVSAHTHSFTPSGTVSSHSHGLNSHTHSFTPSGTVSSHSHGLNNHTHQVGAHTHGLNSHTHSFTPSGTVSSTFTGGQLGFYAGSADSHESSSTASYQNYSGVTITADQSASVYQYAARDVGRSALITWTSQGSVSSNFSGVAGTTGAASGSTAASSVFATGTPYNKTVTEDTKPTFSGTAGTTGAASGSTAAATPTFSGTAGTTGSTTPTFTGTAGTTGSTTPTFTGTAGTTGSTGSGTAVNILPPYVVKYCWERTA